MPARAAPECPMPGMPLRKSAVMLTIDPPCFCMLWLNTSRIIRNPPVRLLATTASKPRFEMAISGEGNWPPALLTSPWIAPCRATTCPIAVLTASSSRMSNAAVSQRPPSAGSPRRHARASPASARSPPRSRRARRARARRSGRCRCRRRSPTRPGRRRGRGRIRSGSAARGRRARSRDGSCPSPGRVGRMGSVLRTDLTLTSTRWPIGHKAGAGGMRRC